MSSSPSLSALESSAVRRPRSRATVTRTSAPGSVSTPPKSTISPPSTVRTLVGNSHERAKIVLFPAVGRSVIGPRPCVGGPSKPGNSDHVIVRRSTHPPTDRTPAIDPAVVGGGARSGARFGGPGPAVGRRGARVVDVCAGGAGRSAAAQPVRQDPAAPPLQATGGTGGRPRPAPAAEPAPEPDHARCRGLLRPDRPRLPQPGTDRTAGTDR